MLSPLFRSVAWSGGESDFHHVVSNCSCVIGSTWILLPLSMQRVDAFVPLTPFTINPKVFNFPNIALQLSPAFKLSWENLCFHQGTALITWETFTTTASSDTSFYENYISTRQTTLLQLVSFLPGKSYGLREGKIASGKGLLAKWAVIKWAWIF